MLTVLAFVLLLAAPQAEVHAETGREPGSELTVYLMTIGQGDAVWEKFGHNAIWVRDGGRDLDVAFNYGMFDFAQPGFLRRFLRGEMLYWMDPVSGPGSTEHYRSANRSVWLQELNLTPAQRVKLYEFLWWNAQEENKFYRYDYYRDNCSTRVRDAIDFALDGQLERATKGVPTGTTYRSHSLRLTESDRAVFTGMLLGLGLPADRPIDAWEEGFIPMKLRDHIRDVRINGPDGQPAPLVLSERTLFEATRSPEAAHPPNRTLAYLAIGSALAAVLVVLARAGRSSAAAGLTFVAFAVLWSLVVGLFGTVLALLWSVTDHIYSYRNENLFQVNPLPLALVVLLPLARKRPRLRRTAARVAVGVAGVAALGLVLQLLPGVDQVNGGIITLALPVHLALAWALVVQARRSPSPERDDLAAEQRSDRPMPAGGLAA